MNVLQRWLTYRTKGRAEQLARREIVLFALLASRPTGWTAYELWRHIGGSSAAIYVLLYRLELDGRIRAWWVEGPYPRRRLYGLPEGEVR